MVVEMVFEFIQKNPWYTTVFVIASDLIQKVPRSFGVLIQFIIYFRLG